MKTKNKPYNCPDCQSSSCEGCQRTIPMPITTTNWTKDFFLNATCKTCPNHISNGGTGICNCTLGTIAIY